MPSKVSPSKTTFFASAPGLLAVICEPWTGDADLGGGRSSWRPGAVALYGFPALPMFGEVVKKR
eukprot:scaffold22146_cov69-Phaeocystis_antarctica.AAC.2